MKKQGKRVCKPCVTNKDSGVPAQSARRGRSETDDLIGAASSIFREQLANMNDPSLAGLKISSTKLVTAAPGQGAQALEWKPDQYLDPPMTAAAAPPPPPPMRVLMIMSCSEGSMSPYLPRFLPAQLPTLLRLSDTPPPSAATVRDRFFALAPDYFHSASFEAGAMVVLKSTVPYYIEANKTNNDRVWLIATLE